MSFTVTRPGDDLSPVASARAQIHGTGEMAELIRSKDWTQTSLGGIETWSETLLATINVLLLSPSAFCLYWGESQTLLYNDRYRQFLGSKHPASLGAHGPSVWQEAWSIFGRPIEAAFHDGTVTNAVETLIPIMIDGTLQDRWWNYGLYPVYERGRILGVAAPCNDETPRLLAKNALLASEAQAKRVLQSIGDAVIVTDVNGRVVRMNSVAEQLTAWTESEAAGRILSDVFRIEHETTTEPAENPLTPASQARAVAESADDTVLLAEDGRAIPIDNSNAPIYDESGQLNGMVLVFRDIAVRRAAERERDQSLGKLNAILDVASEAISFIDRSWVITYQNPAAVKATLRQGQIVGTNFWESYPRESHEESAVLHYYRAMDEGVPADFENYYPKPYDRWFAVSVRPATDGITLSFRDVTEGKALEYERERLLTRLTQIQDSSPDGIAIIDCDWSILYQNAAAERMTALSAQGSVIGRKLWDVYPATIHESTGLVDNYHRTMTERVPTHFEQYDASQDRTLTSFVWPSAEGIIVFVRDVTEQRRAARDKDALVEALQISEESFRIAADVLQLGHCRLELPSLKLVYMTPIFKATYGRGPDDPFTYEDLLNTIHPEDVAGVRAAGVASWQNNEPYLHEYRVIWPDGSLHWIQGRGRLIQFSDGRPMQMQGITMDVTERRLSHAALIQNEKLAAVGRLASSIAHEINNPLESVTNLLYLVAQSDDLAEIHAFVETAERELRRVSLITNQTLRFHKQSTSPSAFYCTDLIGDSLSIYQGRIINSGIEVLKRKRASQAITCFGGEIRQILSNLIGNAIDAMPTGGRLILRSREATHWKTGAKGLVITVADTGTGISPATQKKIFEPFFTTKGIGGTGLGLWICCEIVERHHGTLRMRSSQRENASGTVFALFLPFDSTPAR